jgi:hypothetical protein
MTKMFKAAQIEKMKKLQHDITFSTEKIDLRRFRIAVRKVYRDLGLHSNIPVFRMSSPFVAYKVARALVYDSNSIMNATVPDRVGTALDVDLFMRARRRFDAIIEKLKLRTSLKDHTNGRCVDEKGNFVTAQKTVLGEVTIGYGPLPDQYGEFAGQVPVNDEISAVLMRRATDITNNPFMITDFNDYWIGGYSPQAQVTVYLTEYKKAGGFDAINAGLRYPESVRPNVKFVDELLEMAKAASYWIPLNCCVLVCDRPYKISVNAAMRLHNDNDYALRYRDGWGIVAFNGTVVPERFIYIKPEQLDPYEILTMENAEHRTALMARVGLLRMMKVLKPKTIDVGPDGRSTLIQFVINGVNVRGLHVIWKEADGEHQTIIPVPAERRQFMNVSGVVPKNINSFEEVRLWTFGLRPSDIKIKGES